MLCSKPSKIELVSGCQLPIHKNIRIGIWQPFASFPFSFISLKPSQIELATGISCHFNRIDELATSGGFPFACLPVIPFNCLKSNRQLSASCQLPIHKNFQIGIRLPFTGSLFSCYALKPSRDVLARSYQLPVANSLEFANWHLAAVLQLLFTFNNLNPLE